MSASLAGYIVPNQYGNFIGVIAFAIRHPKVSNDTILLPYARLTAAVDIQHARDTLLIEGYAISDQLETYLTYYTDPVAQRVIYGELMPMMFLSEVLLSQQRQSV